MIKCMHYITEEPIEKQPSVKLNINDTIKVKLTEYGMNVLNKKYNEIQKHHLCQFDDDGYFTTQIWILFALFGAEFATWAPQMFEKNEMLMV